MIGAGDSNEWSVRYHGGFPYLMRWVNHNDQPNLKRSTLNAHADYRLSILQEGDKVLIGATDFTEQSINSTSMPPIIQALLLRMGEGDKIECVSPWMLCDIAGNQEDCYIEIELRKLHHSNHPGINLLPMFSPQGAQSPKQNSGGGS